MDDRCGEVQHAPHRHRIPKRARIRADEARPGVREVGRAAERQLKGLLEQEAAEDHRLVAVAVLRLHDRGRLEFRRGHGVDVGGAAGGVGWVVVGELAEPDGVDEGRFARVGRRGEEGGGGESFFGFGAGGAEVEEGAVGGVCEF